MEWPLHHAHPWDLPAEEAQRLQQHLRGFVQETPLAWEHVGTVAGVDVGFPSPDTARAAIAVFSFPDLELVDWTAAEVPVPMPYVPGLLSFREIPAILEALPKLQVRPDVFLVDGQGIAHPRGLGIAAHLGVLLDWPTVGVAKSLLVGRPQGKLGLERGSTVPLLYRGRVIGMGVRTRTKVKPVWVSIGHRVDLPSSVALVLRTSPRYRLPEPLRAAHRLSKGQPIGRSSRRSGEDGRPNMDGRI